MPELPEMENYRRLLSQLIVNQIITKVEVNREKSINVSVKEFIHSIETYRIIRIERRAKHLLFYLNSNKILLLHLMLGGWMFFGTESEKPDRTVQIRISFGNKHLYFIGLRLGYLHLLTEDAVEEQLQELGPEPLDENFTYDQFKNMIVKKNGMLKTTLTNQKFISGVGNCYSDEICFLASLLPAKKASDLMEGQIENLYKSMQSILTEATKYGGYMESPLYKGDELTGGYDSKCAVYDREGEACTRCGNPIIKDTISSRKTFYCKVCQH